VFRAVKIQFAAAADNDFLFHPRKGMEIWLTHRKRVYAAKLQEHTP
jgi:hypothetical protein